ncbi:MAG: hypothetical protein BAA01_13560 [Bacillus thermozeamaize]|uniref:histidine kinase n=1 Tax=Bacillus thermozeamaize TaxID=230954 RepID=A0A1Y3PHJ5_9BACI|nr:MAG: hypothetical protein BAA01_13560 [Bacillus thermozeamaize]
MTVRGRGSGWTGFSGAGIQENRASLGLQPVFRHGQGPGQKEGRLGLAVCKEIVQAHGGRIRAKSQPGKGSTFSFSLPVHELE